MRKRQEQFNKKKEAEEQAKAKLSQVSSLVEESKDSLIMGGAAEDELDIIIQDSSALKRIESQQEQKAVS